MENIDESTQYPQTNKKLNMETLIEDNVLPNVFLNCGFKKDDIKEVIQGIRRKKINKIILEQK